MRHRGAGRPRRVVFVCEHGAFRSRMAAAYFNATAPGGWSAVSAGVTPQTEVSVRLAPLVAGTAAEAFIDEAAPRSIDEVGRGARTIAIDTRVPGAETWSLKGGREASDEELREKIGRRVARLIREIEAGRPSD